MCEVDSTGDTDVDGRPDIDGRLNTGSVLNIGGGPDVDGGLEIDGGLDIESTTDGILDFALTWVPDLTQMMYYVWLVDSVMHSMSGCTGWQCLYPPGSKVAFASAYAVRYCIMYCVSSYVSAYLGRRFVFRWERPC